jgi:maltose O-acetyltransferase
VGKIFYFNQGMHHFGFQFDANRRQLFVGAPCAFVSAATHPLQAKPRAAGAKLTAPMTLGNDVWIGANATICEGVTLMNNVVVGVGAVVTKNFPENVVIAGAPAKVIKEIDNAGVNE